MRSMLWVCALVCAAGCSKKSSSTVFVDPPALPTAIGTWSGNYSDGAANLYAETVENGAAGDFRGGISLPGESRLSQFFGTFDGQVIEAGTFQDGFGSVEWRLELVPEPEDVREELGFLFEGFWASSTLGAGPCTLRVLPVD